jgi:hypothetical protein
MNFEPSVKKKMKLFEKVETKSAAAAAAAAAV